LLNEIRSRYIDNVRYIGGVSLSTAPAG
jgi:hypothetical protein